MTVVVRTQNPSRICSPRVNGTRMLLHSNYVSRAFTTRSQAVVISVALTSSLSACVVPPTLQKIGYASPFSATQSTHSKHSQAWLLFSLSYTRHASQLLCFDSLSDVDAPPTSQFCFANYLKGVEATAWTWKGKRLVKPTMCNFEDSDF